MAKTSRLGKAGEESAAKYLANAGFRLIGKNIRQKFGELDLVAKDKNGCLVFVEVKTMHSGTLKPEDQMSSTKIRKFKRIAQFFANSHPELMDDNEGWRIDMLALTKIEKGFEIKHYENIA